MLRPRGVLVALVLAGAIASGCSAGPVAAGYLGRWSRSPSSTSIFVLSQDERGAYGFSWRLDTRSNTVRCERPGICVEYKNGDKVFDWRFRVFRRHGEDGLFIEARATPAFPGPRGLHWVDHLLLQPSGELWAYKVEEAGKKLDTPIGPIKYVKLAAADAPSGSEP